MKLNSLIISVVLLCAHIETIGQIKTTEPSKEEELKKYDIDQHVRIPMRDGKSLHGILVIPKNVSQPMPVVLMVNCYPSGGEWEVNRTKVPAKYGYASLMVFNRGKSESEGIFYPFENDANDNYDILEWISKQPWCNGKVGMYGGSYLGFAQWATVKKLHPVLKTIVPQVSVGAGIDFPNPDGVFLTFTLQWLKYVRNTKLTDFAQMSEQKRWDKINNTYMTSGIAFEKLDSLEGNGADTIFQRWLKHPTFDQYWQSFTPTKEEFSKINIPILTTTGYFDDDQRGALYYYNMHNRYGPKEAVRNHYLFIGPFDHGGAQGWPRPSIPPYSIDSAALINQEKLVMEWFDYTLRGAKKPEFLKDRISLFVMGENKWRYFNSTTSMNKDSITYYIDHVAPTSKDLFLSPDKPTSERTARLIFNTASVENDTMHIFTNNNSLVTEDVFRRTDNLVIKTNPFEEDVLLNGAISAELLLVSSASDADLLTTWWEEDAAGKRWPLSFAMQRLSHARDKSKKSALKKNNIYKIKLNNGYWMCRKIAKGSRLVMTVSPLTDRFWQKNYGSSEDVSKQTKRNAGTVVLTVYTGKNFSSKIKIPVTK